MRRQRQVGREGVEGVRLDLGICVCARVGGRQGVCLCACSNRAQDGRSVCVCVCVRARALASAMRAGGRETAASHGRRARACHARAWLTRGGEGGFLGAVLAVTPARRGAGAGGGYSLQRPC